MIERERERETDRQTDRQRQTERERGRDAVIGLLKEKQMNRETKTE